MPLPPRKINAKINGGKYKNNETANVDVSDKSSNQLRCIIKRERHVLVKIYRRNRRSSLRQVQAQ
ncbi:hypothetical protein ABEB36_011068 [Hypothenemus hampei]|uniref:Uncharacterized protein n=1 Tax=Hypothenemus hampei TaxID=57062 RepID=A0ABD1EE20_HYPHA